VVRAGDRAGDDEEGERGVVAGQWRTDRHYITRRNGQVDGLTADAAVALDDGVFLKLSACRAC
jgi:hypothetical protein